MKTPPTIVVSSPGFELLYTFVIIAIVLLTIVGCVLAQRSINEARELDQKIRRNDE